MNRETYLDRVGEDFEPGGRDPAPPPLRIVQKFVNSHNHEFEERRDRLRTPEKAELWLAANGLLAWGARLSDEDVQRLKEARHSIRSLADDPRPETFIEVPARLVATDVGVTVEPSGTAVDRVIGALLAGVHQAMVDESWRRMKLCRQCSWMFFDQSRNRSGGWCSMAICGNRVKNRSYRRRNTTDQVSPR